MDKTLERIMELMRDNKIQDQEMIEYLGLARGTFGNWKRDKGRSYYAYIDKIADRLCVPIDYLIRGKAEESEGFTNEEIGLVESYRRLSKEKQDLIKRNVQLLLI